MPSCLPSKPFAFLFPLFPCVSVSSKTIIPHSEMDDPLYMTGTSAEVSANRTQPIYRPRITHNWGASLVIACLALGFVSAVVVCERNLFTSERGHAIELNNAMATLEARDWELGRVMADPQTRFIPLSGMNSTFQNAMLVWNYSRQFGVLCCDQLPALNSELQYQIWALSRVSHKNAPQFLGQVNAVPGTSIYPFRSSQSPLQFDRIEVTAGPWTADAQSVLGGPNNLRSD